MYGDGAANQGQVCFHRARTLFARTGMPEQFETFQHTLKNVVETQVLCCVPGPLAQPLQNTPNYSVDNCIPETVLANIVTPSILALFTLLPHVIEDGRTIAARKQRMVTKRTKRLNQLNLNMYSKRTRMFQTVPSLQCEHSIIRSWVLFLTLSVCASVGL